MKRVLAALSVLFCVWWLALPVQAEAAQEIYEQSGASELTVNEDAQAVLDEQNLSFSDPQGILSFSPSGIASSLLERVKAELTAPLRLGGVLIAVTILAAMTGGIGDGLQDRSLSRMFEMICVLVCVTQITSPMASCFLAAGNGLQEGGTFMLAFVPVFTTVVAAGGGPVTASAYHMVVLTLAEVAVQIATGILMPLLQMCLALSIVDAVHPTLSLSGFIGGIKKVVTWGLGLVMALFVGLLSVQGVVSTSADSVATKATKFMLSSCVPVVGGAVSDAFSTVRGSLGVLRSGVGGVGIVALAATVLPPLVHLALYRLSLFVAGLAADVLEIPQLRRLFHNLESILSVAIGILACFSFMLLLSTALVMMLCANH